MFILNWHFHGCFNYLVAFVYVILGILRLNLYIDNLEYEMQSKLNFI